MTPEAVFIVYGFVALYSWPWFYTHIRHDEAWEPSLGNGSAVSLAFILIPIWPLVAILCLTHPLNLDRQASRVRGDRELRRLARKKRRYERTLRRMEQREELWDQIQALEQRITDKGSR